MQPKFQDGDIIFDECGSYLVIDFEDVGLYILEDLGTGEVSWYPQDYVETHMSYDASDFDFGFDEIEEKCWDGVFYDFDVDKDDKHD